MIIIVGVLYWLFFILVGNIGVQSFWTSLETSKGLSAFYPFTKGSEYGLSFFLWNIIMSILLQFSYGPYLQKYASMHKHKTVSRSYLLGLLFSQGRFYIILGIGVAALVVMGPKPPEH